MSKFSAPSISIALFEPRIPQNTGNIGRTCVAFNYNLYLIEPLGFDINDKSVKRAGLDYWSQLDLQVYKSFSNFKCQNNHSRIISFSKKGGLSLKEFKFKKNDCLLFGREDLGLPESIKEKSDLICTIDMPCLQSKNTSKGVRSLNLSVACGIAAYYSYCSISNPY